MNLEAGEGKESQSSCSINLIFFTVTSGKIAIKCLEKLTTGKILTTPTTKTPDPSQIWEKKVQDFELNDNSDDDDDDDDSIHSVLECVYEI